MIKRKKKRKFFVAFLAAAVVMLAVQIVLSFPFETLAKQTTTDSSESIYLLDGKADSSLTEKGIEGQKRELELQREQSKSEQKEDKKSEESSETKESTAKNSKDSTKKEKFSSKETEGKSDSKDIALMAGGVDLGTISQNGLTYRIWSDGNAGVVGFSGNQMTTVTIPSTVSSGGTTYKVVDIYSKAFQSKHQINTVNFQAGNNIRLIESWAFSDCTNLQSLDLTNCKNLITIGDEAFSGCRKISSLKFPTGAKLREIGVQAFRNLDGLNGKVLTVPDTVRTIKGAAFIPDDGKSYGEVHHKKVANVTGELPSLEVAPVDLPEEAKTYGSKVDSSQDKTLLHKAAKWTNEERTTAEIRIDYGNDFDRIANLDVIFVIDGSSSMTAPTKAKDSNGIEHSYPRAFLTDDIVYDASKMLMDKKMNGYNNRVAMVGFEGSSTPIFKSNGFIDNSDAVKQFIINNSSLTNGFTNYDTGLQGAIDILDQYQTVGRKPAVIFLSDGVPEPSHNNGITQAEILRARGVNVYPVAIYTGNTITQDLKNISFDGETAYIADDTEAFEKIMKEVLYDVINHAEPLEVQIEDVLSEEFELLTGGQADFDISPDGGQVSVNPNGRKFTWDLRGCAQGVAHTLKIKVKVKEGTELTATGVLDTNDSMGATDNSIRSVEQPKLERYLAHHRFENADDPNLSLPSEVMDLLPGTTGGYGKTEEATASTINPTEVKTADGRTWRFEGWDTNKKEIVDGDVTFVGKWKFIGYDFSFIKLNDEYQGLVGAEFSLYAWKGANDPTDSDLANAESIAAGKWKLLDTQVSQSNGRVDFYVPAEEGKFFQLAETKAPTSYMTPQGQWRFTFDNNGYITNNMLTGIGGQNNNQPPPFEVIQSGEFSGFLGVQNETSGGQLPATGGSGTRSAFTIKAIALWVIGTIFCGIFLFINRRKKVS